jgi:hypothetical protein
MEILLHLLFKEIIEPICYGMGWLVLYVITLGYFRPSEKSFINKDLITMIGGFTWLAVPSVIAITWRAIGS